MDLNGLHAHFPRNAIHWRAAQLLSKKDPNKPKAKALAYLNARDVMERLDEVVGPENWQDSYQETPSGRVICTISIKCGDFWIDKADGSGSTDIEGEKGGISGAFKRAAVKWGIGRYLYDMPTPWVPCKLWNDKFDDWAADPWSYVRNAPKASPPPERNADMPDATDLPPQPEPPKLTPEASIAMSLDTAQSEQIFVEKVAECLRTWGDRGWPPAILDKATVNATRLGLDMKNVGRKARAFNAAEHGAAA